MQPTNQKKRKIVAYCRVSTAMQGSGLEAQVRQVRQYCDLMQIKDVEIFTDENQSGAKQNRPALDRMMKAVRDNEVESVIVPAFSRLARSTTHLLKALDEFKDYNCSFISLSERLDTSTAAGKMAFTLTGQSIPLIRGIEYRVSVVIDPDYVGPLKFTPFPQRAEDYY